MPFVSKFVDGLVRDDKIESTQIGMPRRVQEAALDKLNTRRLLTQALSGQLMHGGGKIQGDIPGDAGQVIEQMLCKKAGAGA